MPDAEIIFRPSNRDNAKALSLHRDSDWQTGLSFLDHVPIGTSISFNVGRLLLAGYTVRFDGGKVAVNIWTGEAYNEPNIGGEIFLPRGHVTVFHPDKALWDEWHTADIENVHTSRVSPQAQALYDLREV